LDPRWSLAGKEASSREWARMATWPYYLFAAGVVLVRIF
jgi:hypothetical protein